MKAVVLTKHGTQPDVLQIQDWEKPSIEAGEVLIEVSAFGLNFADVMARKGLYRAAPDTPCVLGYEVVGKVVECGASSTFKVGDRVLAFTRFGGYAQFVKTDERAAVKVQATDPEEDLLALGTQGVTAYYALKHNVVIHPGDQVLVHSGAGGVGSLMIQMLKHEFDVSILSTAGTDEKCRNLEKLGVTKAFNYSKDNCWTDIQNHIGNKGLQVIFDAVGGSTYKEGFKLLSAGGKMVTYGAAYRTNAKPGLINNIKMLLKFGFTHPLFLMMGSKTICGINMLKVGDEKPEILKHCLSSCLSLYHKGAIQPLTNKLFLVSEIHQAHELLEGRKIIGKVGCKW